MTYSGRLVIERVYNLVRLRNSTRKLISFAEASVIHLNSSRVQWHQCYYLHTYNGGVVSLKHIQM